MPSLVPDHDQWEFHPKKSELDLVEWVDLAALSAAITRDPVREIALRFSRLTYGQMVTLAQELWATAGKAPITEQNLASILHKWSTNARNTQGPGTDL